MKLTNAVLASILTVGFGVIGIAGAGAAGADPNLPGIGFPQKPHDHGDWGHWGKPGHGPKKWDKGWGVGNVDACISATGPYGNVSGFVCI